MPATSVRRALVAAALTMPLVVSAPAWADSASSHVSLNANAVRSVSVSLQTLALGSCTWGTNSSTGNTLGFPNGVCISPVPVQVTNGGVSGQIEAATTNAVPADNGTAWTPAPCQALTFNPCPPPQRDQFLVATSSTVVPTAHTALLLRTAPKCDYAFNGSSPDPKLVGCRVAPMQRASEYLWLEGPASSTDLSSDWSFNVTWTAVP